MAENVGAMLQQSWSFKYLQVAENDNKKQTNA